MTVEVDNSPKIVGIEVGKIPAPEAKQPDSLEESLGQAYDFWYQWTLFWEEKALAAFRSKEPELAYMAGSHSPMEIMYCDGKKWGVEGYDTSDTRDRFTISAASRSSEYSLYLIRFIRDFKDKERKERIIEWVQLIHQARHPQKRVLRTEIFFGWDVKRISSLEQEVKNNTYFQTPFPDNQPRAIQSLQLYWKKGGGVYAGIDTTLRSGAPRYEAVPHWPLYYGGKVYQPRLPELTLEQINQALVNIHRFEPAICLEGEFK